MSEVTVVLTVNEVAITKRNTEVEVVQLVQSVGLTSPGPQGPRGPAGAPGSAGGTVYLFEQAVASATWVINHNIGRQVAVVLFDDDNNVVHSDIEHGTINQATVTWSQPTTGSALVL